MPCRKEARLTLSKKVRFRLLTHIAVIFVLCVSCRSDLPLAPSDLTAGIVIYDFQDFQGQSAHITEDISNLDDVNGPCRRRVDDGGTQPVWGDCISSVRIAPGWEAHLYEDDDFQGWDQVVLDDISDLGEVLGPCHSDNNMDNCASSIRVLRR